MKETLSHLSKTISLTGKRIILRVDFNVPLDENQCILDDTRIKAVLPTIQFLQNAHAKISLLSHLGRPNGDYNVKYSLKPVFYYLEKRLKNVSFCSNFYNPPEIENGNIVLFENVRFESGEETNDESFAKHLSTLGEIYVNDAFGTVHRAHASTEGVVHYMEKNCIGFLMERELNYLDKTIRSPRQPFAAIIGGSKISSKITVLENLIPKIDKLFIGGGMVFTFLFAHRHEIGNSIVEKNAVNLVYSIEKLAKKNNTQIFLPIDIVVADKFDSNANTKIVPYTSIPQGWIGMDNGPETCKLFSRELKYCKTILWNGPMGVFEMKPFSNGTFQVAKTVSSMKQHAVTIVGGGDTVSAIEKFHMKESFCHISTGGGACLELLEGKDLPGLKVIQNVVDS